MEVALLGLAGLAVVAGGTSFQKNTGFPLKKRELPVGLLMVCSYPSVSDKTVIIEEGLAGSTAEARLAGGLTDCLCDDCMLTDCVTTV